MSGMYWRYDFPSGKNPLRFFFFSSRFHWKTAIFAISTALVANIFAASVSYIFKLIANAAAALPNEGAYGDLLVACGLYILFLALAKGFWRLSGFAGSAWAMGALATARHSLTSYVTLHSRAYFSERFAGSIANKISHAARGMREMVDQFLWEFLEVFVTAIVSFGIAFTVNVHIALIFLAWVIAVVLANVYMVKKRIPLSSISQKLETNLNGATVDLLTNITAMQEYVRRPFEIARLEKSIEERITAGLRNWRFGEWIRIVNSVLLVIFGSAMVYAVLFFVQRGGVSLGDVVLVIAIIFRIENQLQSLGSNLNRFAETWGEVEESLDEIIEPHGIADSSDAASLETPRGEIEFRNVVFKYEKDTIFETLNLHIRARERVGLVGKSGAGKTTLMQLLTRHYDLVSGAILVDSKDISKISQTSLRSAFSTVPQEPLLFHRTIRENISYGKPDATDAEIRQAAHMAQAHNFITKLPHGYNSLVGERGIKLSGGERQRVAIARAILKNAPILLLDEATSSLDSESEKEIQAALHELMKGKTVIAIAHRLSTLREMDRIVVLENGRVVEDGTHDQLLKQGGTYAQLWEHQAGGFLQDE